jgi:transketolase
MRMPLTDSKTNKVIQDFSTEELKERANYMRGLNLLALCSAKSGHSGGTLGVMDMAAALYLKVARHDPKNPDWADRDRIIWSAGHKAPALYTALAVSGYHPEEDLITLRMLGSKYQGHPHRKDLPGVEISSGSLGQGFSVAVGVALAAKLDKKDYRTFVVSSDGEQQEGSMWEAAMSASHHGLDNLVIMIDLNGLQIDGATKDVMTIEPLADKYRSFGWHVIEADGHDVADLTEKLGWARNKNDTGKPVCVICKTIKGKGVSFMEDQVGWHGKPPSREELDKAFVELKLTDTFNADEWLARGVAFQKKVEARLTANMPKFSTDFWWNTTDKMKVAMDPTRKGFGRALQKHGGDERIVCLGADISGSITISQFNAKNPERNERFISMGIAEQNATTVAAGLAKEGKIPVFGTYGVFSAYRNLDQVRVSVCYGDFNVLIVGAHGGVSVGPDGATHQELESLFQMTGLPKMHVGVPCDSIETEKMTKAMLFDIVGPKFIRFAREATPIVTTEDSPFKFGEANVHRFRKEADNLVDGFEIKLASEYKDEGEKLTLISCGPETPEALRAAWILKKDFGIETRVLNIHTLKPLDRDAIVRAAKETGAVITAEEHQVGGLGNLVAAVLARTGLGVKFDMVGVEDRFGESGQSWQLVKEFGLAAEHIADRAKKLLKL